MRALIVNNIDKNVKLEKLKNSLSLTCYFEYFLESFFKMVISLYRDLGCCGFCLWQYNY